MEKEGSEERQYQRTVSPDIIFKYNVIVYPYRVINVDIIESTNTRNIVVKIGLFFFMFSYFKLKIVLK